MTLVAAAIAVFYSLFVPGPLSVLSSWPALFIFGHSGAMAVCLGRFRTGRFGYLYSRGFGHDTAWAYTILASVLGALAAWLPAALIILLGVRSFVQDLMKSPYYPVIADPLDAETVRLWLVFYVFFLPMMHYAWIRDAYAASGGRVGKMLVVVIFVVAPSFFVLHPPFPGFLTLACAVGLAGSIIVLFGGRLVHLSLIHI